MKYLRTIEGTAIRATGFLGMAKNDCSWCSAFPDSIEPALKDVGSVVNMLDELIVTLQKGEQE